jgi:predicted metal-dependent phosphoesterase TrpH
MGNRKKQRLVMILLVHIIFALIILIISLFQGPIMWIKFAIFEIVAFLWITASLLLSLMGPGKYKYRNEDWDDESMYYAPNIDKTKWNITLDTHSHTSAYEGKLTVKQNILYHLSVGFNACVITEHNTFRNIDKVLKIKEMYKDQIVVIPGLEYTTSRVHMCFIGITEWDCDSIPSFPTDEEIKEAIEKVHKLGGVVSVCHYPWSTWGENPRMPDHPTREQMLSWGVDLIECASWGDDISLFDLESYEFAQSHPNISPCAGTDTHDPYKEIICGWTVLKTKEFSQEAIMEELRKHKTDVVFEYQGRQYPIIHAENVWYKIFRPFIMLGESFQTFWLGGKLTNQDVAAINAWFIYAFLLFILALIL